GEERLRAVFERNRQPEKAFDEILGSVQEFIGGGEKNDDLSLLEIVMEEPHKVDSVARETIFRRYSSLAEWDMCFEIKPTSFHAFDTLPLLLNEFIAVPGPRKYGGTLYTIAADLYSNALDHCVLKLDSAMKDTPESFTRHYQVREPRLRAVSAWYIRIHLRLA